MIGCGLAVLMFLSCFASVSFSICLSLSVSVCLCLCLSFSLSLSLVHHRYQAIGGRYGFTLLCRVDTTSCMEWPAVDRHGDTGLFLCLSLPPVPLHRKYTECKLHRFSRACDNEVSLRHRAKIVTDRKTGSKLKTAREEELKTGTTVRGIHTGSFCS